MTRDEQERLLIDLLPFIRDEARILSRRVNFLNEDDLAQEGAIAAWLKLDDFDESLGYKTWTFIRPRVVGGMLDYVRRRRSLFAKFSRERKMVTPVSLSKVLTGRANREPTTLGDVIADYRHSPADEANDAEDMEDLLKHCTPKNRVLLRRLFVTGDTQREIAAEQDKAPSVVSYHVERALTAIRSELRRMR